MQHAIRALAEGSARRGLATRAVEMSTEYRHRQGSDTTVRSETDVAAYTLTRLPATYAAVEDMLSRLTEGVPGFEPQSLLDLGCGPGTASWAAVEAFPSLRSATLVDRNAHFRAAAGSLSHAHEVLDRATITNGDLHYPPPGKFDLVLLSYALTEVADPIAAADAAWDRTAGILCIIEPGTPRDYQRLLRVRDRLLSLGGTIVAPCPHHLSCPLVAPDWCHFSVRLSRTRDHMQLKGGTLGYEDEKFSYLVVARPVVDQRPGTPRVLAKPSETKFDITLKLCEPDGTARSRNVLKRDANTYRAARKAKWGDAQ